MKTMPNKFDINKRIINSRLEKVVSLFNRCSSVEIQRYFDELESEILSFKLSIYSQRRFFQIIKNPNTLTRDEVSSLNKLNNACHVIQDEILKVYDKSFVEILEWSNEKSQDEIKDNEIFIKITCYIGKDDPEWNDESDNIIADFDQSISADMLYELNECGSELRLFLDRPHSYIFHSLYDHSMPRLSWNDILKIRTICAEVHTWKQLAFQIQL